MRLSLPSRDTSPQEFAAYCAVGLGCPSLAVGVSADVIERQAARLFEARVAMGGDRYRHHLLWDTATSAVVFGAVTAAMTNNWKWAVGVAIGAAVLAVCKTRRNYRGVAHIRDGKRSESRFFLGDPRYFPRSEQDIAAYLRATGLVRDTIGSIPVSAIVPTSAIASLPPEVVAQVRELAAARRLVADVGVVATRGEAALSVLSALQSLHLLAQGKALLVISCAPVETKSHDLLTTAATGSGVSHVSEASRWSELSVSYACSPFVAGADVPLGDGVPDVFNGVYRDANRYSEIVVSGFSERVDITEILPRELPFLADDFRRTKVTHDAQVRVSAT